MKIPARLLAWLLLGAVVVVTVAPIQWRPATGAPADLERFFAFATVGALFSIGYPRRVLFITACLIFTAFALEAAQTITMTRHAHLSDFTWKSIGAAVGVWAVEVPRILTSRWIGRVDD